MTPDRATRRKRRRIRLAIRRTSTPPCARLRSPSSLWPKPARSTTQPQRKTSASSPPGPILWRMLSAISASITVNFSAVFRSTLHKPTGRLTPPLPFGRKSVIRRKNGRPGPSRSAPMTLITAATKCPTTGNTGHLTLTRTSGSLASMAGRR